MLKLFIVSKSELTKFCQIHQINFFQKTLKRRMNKNVDNNILHWKTFFQLQRLLKKINFYVDFLKTCENRFLKNFNFDIKIYLKQHNFSKQNKSTHNKFIFSEITTIIIFFDNMSDDRSIERNILIQSIHDNIIFIFFLTVLLYAFAIFFYLFLWRTKLK